MSKVHDLVISTKKDIPQTRKGGKHSFISFRRDDEEEIKLAREERHQKELAKIAQEVPLLRAVEEEQKRVEIVEDTKNSSGLSEFFSAISKEKNETRQKIKENIANPETGLSELFQQLEEALQETQKVSVEEIPDNTKLSADDQNKLEVFSDLLNAFDSDKEIPIKVEPINFVEELEPEEIIPEELVVESEEPHEIIEPPDEIIASVIRNLDDMRGKTQVKEEVDQISSIRKEFDNFRSLVAQQIASSQMSGAGSGETRLEFLDDIQITSAKVDGKFLSYSDSAAKWVGATALLKSNLLLNGTDSSSTNAGSSIVLNTEADVGDQILYEDATSDMILVLASHGITLAGVGWNAFQLDNDA